MGVDEPARWQDTHIDQQILRTNTCNTCVDQLAGMNGGQIEQDDIDEHESHDKEGINMNQHVQGTDGL